MCPIQRSSEQRCWSTLDFRSHELREETQHYTAEDRVKAIRICQLQLSFQIEILIEIPMCFIFDDFTPQAEKCQEEAQEPYIIFRGCSQQSQSLVGSNAEGFYQ